MTRPATLQDALLAQRATARGITFIGRDGDDARISYVELVDRASRILTYLHLNGVAPGSEP